MLAVYSRCSFCRQQTARSKAVHDTKDSSLGVSVVTGQDLKGGSSFRQHSEHAAHLVMCCVLARAHNTTCDQKLIPAVPENSSQTLSTVPGSPGNCSRPGSMLGNHNSLLPQLPAPTVPTLRQDGLVDSHCACPGLVFLLSTHDFSCCHIRPNQSDLLGVIFWYRPSA